MNPETSLYIDSMRIGLIDLGTNSVRFDIHEVTESGKTDRLYRDRVMVRLGEAVFTTKNISRQAGRRTIEAITGFRETADVYDVSRIVAVGTSALRDASNGGELVLRIEEKTGIRVEIITGDEEADLIARGILKNEKDLSGPTAIIDIGGGSTEIIVCENRHVLRSASFNLGTLRLQKTFLKSTPPKQPVGGRVHPLNELKHQARTTLSARIIREGWPLPKRLIGASGTVRTLVKMGRKSGDKNGGLERDTLEKLIDQMSPMGPEELLKLPGIEPRRVDIILAGAVLLEEIMDVFRSKKVCETEYSLREGLLDREVEQIGRSVKR